MASSTSLCSSGGKQGMSVPSRSQTSSKQDKRWSTVDEYRYLAAASGLLGQQVPKRCKPKSHRTLEGEDFNTDRPEQNQTEKRTNGLKNESDIETIKNLSKEMGRMLSNAKSKGHTNELLKLFKNTLNNFVTDKQQHSPGSGERSDINVPSLSNKQAVKQQQTQAKRLPAGTAMRKREKPAVTSSWSHPPVPPPLPSEPKHSKQSIKTVNSSEYTVLSNRERSVITRTTTVTRTKVREPMMSKMIESSKMNVLHRCYGKQSIKPLPLTYKGTKKSVNSSNCQRPAVGKTRNAVKAIKLPQQSSATMSQQMKTIYENEQFDKSCTSESVIKSSESVVKPFNTIAKSAHSLGKLSDSAAKLSNFSGKSDSVTKQSGLVKRTSLKSSVEVGSTDQNVHLPKMTDPEDKKESVSEKPTQYTEEESENQEAKQFYSGRSSIPQALADNVMCDNTSALPMNPSEQDNSLVQRLTSFWNKKLNTDRNESNSSSQSSVGSSNTTYVINASSKENLKSSEKCSNDNLSDLPVDDDYDDDYDDDDDKFISTPVTGSSDRKGKKVNSTSELPDIKIGLMDELIRVLKNGNNNPRKFTKENIISVKRKENCEKARKRRAGDDQYVEEANRPEKSTCSACNISTGSSDGFNECTDDEYSTEDIVVDDFDDADISDYDNECNEETIEAIQTCLLRTITVRNFNKNNSDEADQDTNEDGVISDDYGKERLDQDDKNLVEVCEMTEEEQYQSKHDKELDNIDAEDRIDNETKGTNESTKDVEESSLFNGLTSDSNDKITAAIVNVNDIIVNLRNLMYTIETIPDELKTLNLDLNNLAILNRIKQTISLIVDSGQKQESALIKGLLAVMTPIEIASSPDSDPVVAQDCCARNSLGFTQKTMERCKREASLFTCYFASTFTIPIFESVSNPIQLILFPRRYDYIKSKTKQNQVRFCSDVSEELVSNMDGYITNVCEATMHENRLNDSASQQSTDVQSVNEERYAYMARAVSTTHTPHFTLFYGSLNPSKIISNKVSPSVLFQPCKTKAVVLNKNFLQMYKNVKEPETEHDIYTTKKNSVLDLVRTTSNDSCNLPLDNDNKDNGNDSETANVNCDRSTIRESESICSQDNCVSFADINLSNETNVSRQTNCNGLGGGGRRRRLWRQSYAEEDNNTTAGGAGDYSGVMIPFPCHPTSSMSVIVSSSINDTNSQPDIHVIESEYRLRSYTGTMSRLQSEPENFGCDVIQESREEHMSDIDDCVMVEEHQKVEIKRNNRVSSDASDKDETREGDFNACNRNAQDDDENCGLQLDQSISTSQWGTLNKSLVRDVSTMVSVSKASFLHTDNNSDKGADYSQTSKNEYNQDYVVFCCNNVTPRKTQRDIAQNNMNSKYDLDVLFDRDPEVKQELASVINIDHLCDKEKQLIAICLMLLKQKTSLFDNSIFNILFQNFGKRVNSLWNVTSQNITGKMMGAKEALIIKCQTKTKLLIRCSYRRLIKIVYTTLISLVLCFIIQKQFCGIPLPIYFPW